MSSEYDFHGQDGHSTRRSTHDRHSSHNSSRKNKRKNKDDHDDDDNNHLVFGFIIFIFIILIICGLVYAAMNRNDSHSGSKSGGSSGSH